MTFEDQEVLRRFHLALVRELQASADDLGSPFTVAEIYQNLVPYRTHRDELAVEMNADYEHALLRLLAGEGDFLTIESRTARQEIQDELSSPNPNTGLYRDFAAADVRLNPHLVDQVLIELGAEAANKPEEEVEVDADGASQVEGEMEGEDQGPETVEAPAEEALDSGEQPPELSGEESSVTDEQEEESAEELGSDVAEESAIAVMEEGDEDRPPFETCPWCRESLPQRGGVKFCPFCGSNVQLVPCPACGEELELNWRFCIACGMEVDS